MHAFSAAMLVDLTPQAGRLATWCAANRIGYVGVCQTEYQKDYILKQAEADVMRKLADPASGISIPKFVNAEAKEKEGSKRPDEGTEQGEGESDKKKIKLTPPETPTKKDAGEDAAEGQEDPEGGVKLSPALAKLLKAASSKDGGAGDVE